MAGILVLGDRKYISTLTVKGDSVQNGAFVVPDYAEGTVSLPTGEADGEVMFVENENTNIYEEGIGDDDFEVKEGQFARANVPQAGNTYVTNSFDGSLAEGDIVAVGAGGKLVDGSTRDGAKYKFVVKKLTVLAGKDAVKVVAL